jgi:hypothetical protein
VWFGWATVPTKKKCTEKYCHSLFVLSSDPYPCFCPLGLENSIVCITGVCLHVYHACIRIVFFFCFVCFKRLRRRWLLLLLLLLRLWLNNNNNEEEEEEGDMEAALSFLAPTFPSLMPCSPPFSSGPPRRCATLRGFASEEEKGPWRGRK